MRSPMLKSDMLISSAHHRLASESAIRALFDTGFYLSRNGDVAESRIDAFTHYLQFGRHEGRSPNPLFDPIWYVSRYPEVADAGIDPLTHFLVIGAQKGHDPHWSFDTGFYLSRMPAGALLTCNPLVHYLSDG